MKVSVGLQLTERQEDQRELIEVAAAILRKAGFGVKAAYLMCGHSFPKTDSAMITIEGRDE